MAKPDDEFLRSLSGSQGAVKVAADWLRARGYEVRVPELRVRPAQSQAPAYLDNGDLHVSIDGTWKVVEVKEIMFCPLRELARTPGRTIIIDNASSFARTNPHGYVLVDRDRTIGVVRSESQGEWSWVSEYIGPDRQVKAVIRVPMRLVRLFS